jgi:hypothetical protein
MVEPAVEDGHFYDLPFTVTGAFQPPGHVKVAIWWPENVYGHSQIDLALIRPNGTTAESTLPTANGVFKKVSATTSLATGIWKVRLFATSVIGTQPVYISVHKR